MYLGIFWRISLWKISLWKRTVKGIWFTHCKFPTMSRSFSWITRTTSKLKKHTQIIMFTFHSLYWTFMKKATLTKVFIPLPTTHPHSYIITYSTPTSCSSIPSFHPLNYTSNNNKKDSPFWSLSRRHTSSWCKIISHLMHARTLTTDELWVIKD